jgi:hypothetical protein
MNQHLTTIDSIHPKPISVNKITLCVVNYFKLFVIIDTTDLTISYLVYGAHLHLLSIIATIEQLFSQFDLELIFLSLNLNLTMNPHDSGIDKSEKKDQ